jgi:uncharacterized iron-regulated membrane protein
MLRSLHQWLGLIAGLFVVIMALSGSVVVFRPMFESSVEPKATAEGPANVTLAAQSLEALHPGARIARVIFPETPPEPLLLQAETADQGRVQIFFDPASGAVLGLKKKLPWLDWIADLHQNLLMGKTGRALTGVPGIALLLLSVSGLLSWLAGQRDWKRSLAVPQGGPWRRLNYEAHRWAGLWSNLLLLAVSFTGIVLAFPDTFQQTIHVLAGEPRPLPRPVPDASAAELQPLDEYVRAAAASIPAGVVRELRLPTRNRPTVSVAMWAPGDLRPKGTDVVLLDPSSAKVLSVERSSSLLSKQFVDLSDAIHKSEWGGLPVKLVWALLGLAPLLLFLSGVQIWWHKRQTLSRAALRVRSEHDAPAAETLAHK